MNIILSGASQWLSGFGNTLDGGTGQNYTNIYGLGTGGGYFGGIKMIVSNNSSTLITAMTIDKTGNVGIGISTPSASLHISGTVLIDRSLLLNQTSSSLASGTQTIATKSTGSYTSVFYNYTVASASNARAGQVMIVWNGGSIQYTDNSTLDIGSTSNVVFTASLSGSNINLTTVLPSNTWTVKTLANFL
jgi:hypothetical protein